MPPKGTTKVNGVWVPAAAARADSPAPSLASVGSGSWDKLSPVPSAVSAGSPPFLTPTGPMGGLTPPGGMPHPQAVELAKRLLEQQLPQQAAAKGAAKAKSSASWLWRAARTSTRHCCGRRWGLLTQWALFLGLCMMAPAWLAPSLTRSVGAVVNLSEDLADAGGAIAQVAKNATLLVPDVAVSLTKGSMSIAREAWSGVDLADSSVNASGARFLVLQGATREAFERNELSITLEPLPAEYYALLWNAIAGVDELVPHVSVSEHRFRTASYFDFFEYEVRLFPSGYLGVRFVWARMSFRAVWANPVWELVGADVSPELEAIASRTREAVSGALDLAWLRAPLSEEEDELVLAPPAWVRWVQQWRQRVRWASIASGIR